MSGDKSILTCCECGGPAQGNVDTRQTPNGPWLPLCDACNAADQGGEEFAMKEKTLKSSAPELTWRDLDHRVDLYVLHLLETGVMSFSDIFAACAKADACQTWQGPEVFRESLVAWGFKIDASDTVSV